MTRIQGSFKIHGNGKGAVTDAYRSDSAGICQAHLERSGSRFLRKCQEPKRNSVFCQRSVVATLRWPSTRSLSFSRSTEKRTAPPAGFVNSTSRSTVWRDSTCTRRSRELWERTRSGTLRREFSKRLCGKLMFKKLLAFFVSNRLKIPFNDD